MANKNLNDAGAAKRDEFYTQLTDIQEELRHYKVHFRGKTVLCNCDDPRVSMFFHYFAYNFEALGLKRLITTCYKSQERDLFSQHDCERAIYLVYDGDRNGNRVPDPEEIGIHELQGDGDFRSPECIELLKQADIVVPNPPLSLFREYIAQLMEFKKKFLILGNKNAVHYKEVFSLIRDNQLWIGVTPMSKEIYFDVPQEYINDSLAKNKDRTIIPRNGKLMARSPSIWFTNLDHKKRHEELILYKSFSPQDYPTYDNFNAIDIGRTDEIPCDWFGMMGVPDAFLDKYNPDQFEIVGLGCGDLAKQIGVRRNHRGRTDVAFKKDGIDKCPYSRIIIRRRSQ